MDSIKDFENDFYRILTLLKNGTPFAFNRFSDGELFIFQNKELILDNNLIKVGDKKRGGPYKPEDFKRFDPNEHTFFREKLLESFLHRQENYFKGLSCKCCVGQENFHWQLNVLQESKDDPYLTWANLLLNGNYPKFLSEMYPYLSTYPKIFICNEKANLNSVPNIVKSFRVGYNAMINDYPLIENIKAWIKENDIKNHLFLFSASSFSKMAIHQLFREFPKNTYIDIGTTLNCFINMSIERQYLGDFWNSKPSPSDIYKKCIW